MYPPPKLSKSTVAKLRTLYAMMAGIPTNKVYLNHWKMNGNHTKLVNSEALVHSCGTVGCILGFASAYPPFKAQGLTERVDGVPVYRGYYGYEAGAKFFGIGPYDAHALFGTTGHFNHKQVALQRIREFLLQHGAITLERSNELAAEEATLN
jgi:hypothetical protein